MGNCLAAQNHDHHALVQDDLSTIAGSTNGIGRKFAKNKRNDKSSNSARSTSQLESTNLQRGNKASPQKLISINNKASPDPTEYSNATDTSSPITSSALPLSPLAPKNVSNEIQRHHGQEVRYEGNNTFIEGKEGVNVNNHHTMVISTNLGLSPHESVSQSISTKHKTSLRSNDEGIQKPNKPYYSMSIEELNPPSSPRQKSPRSGRHHAGRALQGRIQRAQDMQRYLAETTNHSGIGGVATGSGSLKSRTSVEYASSGEESSTASNTNNGSRKHHRTFSSKYSTLSNVSDGTFTVNSVNSNNTNTQELQASLMSQKAVWAEIELEDTVLCTCLSRTKASLSKSCRSLYIAVGTANGQIHIQEIFSNDAEIASINDGNLEVAMDQNLLSRKLGHVHQLQVSGKVRSLDFSTDGQYLAAGGDSGICSIFFIHYALTEDGSRSKSNFDTNERISTIHCITEIPRIDRIYAIQFSPDAKYLAVGGFDGAVAIMATKDFVPLHYDKKVKNNHNNDLIEPVAEIPRDGLILTVDWSPDSRYLAIGGSDKCCAIVNTSASWKVFKEIKRSASVQSVQWYPNTGKYLAIGSSDVAIVVGRDSFTTITEVDIRSSEVDVDGSTSNDPQSSQGDRLNNGFNSSRNNARSVYRTNAVCWSPNGSYFVVCDSNRKCTILETRSFSVVHEMARNGRVTCVDWGQQSIIGGIPNRFLAVGGEDKKVTIFKAGIEVNAGTSSITDDFSHSASSASYFSTRSDWILKDNAFRDMEDIKEVPETIEKIDETKSAPKQLIQLKNIDDAVTSNDDSTNDNNSVILAITFSNGSKSKPSMYFAYAADTGLVTVHYVKEWKILADIQFPAPINSLAFSNGGANQFLALGGIDSNVYISDTTNNYTILAKIVLTSPVTSVSFSKNNDRLAAGSLDGTFALLNPANSFEYCGEIETNNADGSSSNTNTAILAVDWSSKNLAIGREDGSVTIFDSKQVVKDVYNPIANMFRTAAVYSLAFGVSSRFLAVGGADHIVGIYSSKGSWALCHQVRMDCAISSVRWSPVGRYLACGSIKGRLKVIDTVFWTDVEEADKSVGKQLPSTSTENFSALSYKLEKNARDKKTNVEESQQYPLSNIAFSQDGIYLSYTRADQGTSVLDSSNNWKVCFRHNKNTQYDAKASAKTESSSISSSGEECP